MWSKICISAFSVVLIPVSISAGDAGAGDSGSTGMAFLKVGVDAAANGMGGAASALASGASAVYWNPAGLAISNGKEALFSHQEWIAGAGNQYLGLSIPAGRFTLGIGAMLSGVGDIERRDERPTEQPLGYFGAHNLATAFSAAFKRGETTAFGITLKHLYEKIYYHTATGFAIDAGVIRHMGERISLAAVLKDVGKMSELKNKATPLPARAVVGVSAVAGPESADFRLKLSGDGGVYFKGGIFFRAGAEAALNGRLFLRGGYRYNGENSSGLTAGVGVAALRYKFDYAYIPFDFDLGDTHQLSISVGF